jgi:hypothetical protein
MALGGARLVSVGGPGLTGAVAMAKETAFEMRAPEGLETVMDAVPALATSVAEMEAVSWVVLTKVVVRGEPLKLTTAPLTKFEPLTANVKAPEPTVTVAGDSVVTVAATRLAAAAFPPLPHPTMPAAMTPASTVMMSL